MKKSLKQGINNNQKSDKIENLMNQLIDESEQNKLTKEEKEFNKYSKLYEKKFGKKAYIAEPNGTRKKTIDAIKICLEKKEDLLDDLLYLETYDNKMI